MESNPDILNLFVADRQRRIRDVLRLRNPPIADLSGRPPTGWSAPPARGSFERLAQAHDSLSPGVSPVVAQQNAQVARASRIQ